MSKNSEKIPNIGLIIPSIDQYFEREMLSKLFFGLENRACNIHIFCGQSIPADDPAMTHGQLISVLPAPGILDGLIITTASIINYTKLENVKAIIDQYQHIPIVSVSYPLESTYNISLNNEKGIHDITTHLIKDHGFTDIVHIAGPKFSLEAQDRAKAFLYTLQKHGLIKDNKRIIRASFSRDTGKAAAIALLKDYKTRPEAVVCPSDEVAFGFIKELNARGVQVPDDITVTGFDNVISSKLATPTISTVNQPLEEMMSRALSIIIDIHEGKTPEKNHLFDPQLVLRESCTCRGIKKNIIATQDVLNGIASLPFVAAETDEQIFRENRALILDTLKASLGDPLIVPKGVDRFLTVIFESMVSDFCQNLGPTKLTVALERFFIWAHRPYNETLEWKRLSFTLERVYKALFPSPERKKMVDQFCLQLLFDMDAIAHKICQRDLFNQYDWYTLGNRVIDHFSAVTTYEQMHLAFRAICELVNFKECYCCLLRKPVLINGPADINTEQNITMVFGKYQHQLLEETEFTTKTMLPKPILEQGGGQSLAYFALNSGNLYYGYFACDLDNMLKPLPITIRQQLSSILDRLDLLDKLEEDTQKIMRISLHDALTGLLNRRGFFEQGQRILLEALQKKQSLVLLFGDMDDLKGVNDTYGHQSGDLALKSVARCLKDILHEGDIVSRFGGDEFALLIRSDNHLKDISQVLNTIQNNFDQFNQLSTLPYDVHVSFGYATKQETERKDLETMIEEADQRLYSEKSRRKAEQAQQ